MRSLLGTTAAFVVVVLTGGAWIGLASRIPGGGPGLGVAIAGGVFCIAFMWLLIVRLRRLLARPDRRWIELGLLAANFAILVLAFAWVHHRIGLVDLSGPGPRGTRDFGDALYFSVVTITTLGYGDFIPIGSGRTIAAIQALTGYFILGILVSTGFQLIAPHTDPGRDDAEDDGEDAHDRSGDGRGRGGAGRDSDEGGEGSAGGPRT
jgi:uncharacterized membrane protein YgcG